MAATTKALHMVTNDYVESARVAVGFRVIFTESGARACIRYLAFMRLAGTAAYDEYNRG